MLHLEVETSLSMYTAVRAFRTRGNRRRRTGPTRSAGRSDRMGHYACPPGSGAWRSASADPRR